MRVGIASTEAQLLPTYSEQASHFKEIYDLFGNQAAYRMVIYRDNLKTRDDVIRASYAASQWPIHVSCVLIDSPKNSLDGFVDWCVRTIKCLPNVHHFVLWNEVNTNVFWPHSIQRYADLVFNFNLMRREMRAGLSWSVCGLARSHKPLAWLREYKRLGGPLPALSAHIYGVPTYFYGVQLRAIIGKETPLYLDEVGISGAPAGDYRAFRAVAYSVSAESLLYYRLQDSPDEIKTGLRNVDGTKKAAYEAVRLPRGDMNG